MTVVTFKGATALVDEGNGPFKASDEVARELAAHYLKIENVRDADLRLGERATILWSSSPVRARQKDGAVEIFCQGCGATENLGGPLTVGSFHDRFRPFGHTHENCGDAV